MHSMLKAELQGFNKILLLQYIQSVVNKARWLAQIKGAQLLKNTWSGTTTLHIACG